MTLFDTITIIGVGLLGGSVGLAAKSRHVAKRVVGVGRNRETLELAVKLGALDEAAADVPFESELVIVGTPVDSIAAVIQDALPNLRNGCIVTDVGSTKANIIAALHDPNRRYVGSHPLAGREKSGVEHASADLFDGRTVVVTTDRAEESALSKVESFWQRLGARVLRMTATEHDEAMAFTSHLPHAVAAAVAGTLPPHWLPLAASGFRDTTRVAAGDVPLWDAIFAANRAPVLAAADAFAQRFEQFRQQLAAGDHASLRRWLDEGKQVRDALGS